MLSRVLATNPAAIVRGPTLIISRGKTPVLSGEEVRHLLASISTDSLLGLRDRALISVMLFAFARVSATVGLDVEDYFAQGKRWWLRLREKRGRVHEIPVHHLAEEPIDAYLEAAGIGDTKGTPMLRAATRSRQLSEKRRSRADARAMIKRRARNAGLSDAISPHSFRATGITLYLEGGGSLETAQLLAGHASIKTTRLYDRRDDAVTLQEIERIRV